jgi:Holliday junction resolvasome RuvABC endonuclease subunit
MESWNSSPYLILGVDPSLKNTGLALMDNVLSIKATCLISTEDKLYGIERLLYIQRKTLSFLDYMSSTVGRPVLICMEGPSYGSKTSSLFELGELSGILQETFFLAGISYIMPSPMEVKKDFAGIGTADKDQMRVIASTIWPQEAPKLSEHEIDALAMCRYGYNFYNALTKPMERVYPDLVGNFIARKLMKDGVIPRDKKSKGKKIEAKCHLFSPLDTCIREIAGRIERGRVLR